MGRHPQAVDYGKRAIGDALQAHRALDQLSPAAGCLSIPNRPFLIDENLLLLPGLEAIEVDAFTLPPLWRAAAGVPGNVRLQGWRALVQRSIALVIHYPPVTTPERLP